MFGLDAREQRFRVFCFLHLVHMARAPPLAKRLSRKPLYLFPNFRVMSFSQILNLVKPEPISDCCGSLVTDINGYDVCTCCLQMCHALHANLLPSRCCHEPISNEQ